MNKKKKHETTINKRIEQGDGDGEGTPGPKPYMRVPYVACLTLKH